MPNPRKPEKATITICAYCGVGCGFKAELKGGEPPARVVCAVGRNRQLDVLGSQVLGVFTDIDVQLGERVFVFTMDRDLQNAGR